MHRTARVDLVTPWTVGSRTNVSEGGSDGIWGLNEKGGNGTIDIRFMTHDS
jgi:hypothetical protein